MNYYDLKIEGDKAVIVRKSWSDWLIEEDVLLVPADCGEAVVKILQRVYAEGYVEGEKSSKDKLKERLGLL